MGTRHLDAKLAAAATVAAVLAFAPAPADATFDGYHLPKELLLAAAAVVLAGRTDWLRGADRISVAAWSLAACTVLSASAATNGWLAFRAAGLTLSGVTLFEAVRRLDVAGRERVVRAAVWAAIALACIAFIESQGLLPGLTRAGRAPGGTVGQRNQVAHVLVLALPFVASRRPAGALLLAAVIVLTRCRSAWVALPVALIAARQWRPLMLTALGATVAALLPVRLEWSSPAPLRDSLTRLFDLEHGSGLGRVTQWRASLGLLATDPLFGVGPANWMVEYPTVSPPHDPSFNTGAQFPTGRLLSGDWVALLVERGLLGVAAVATLGVSSLRRLREAPAHGTLAALVVVGAFDAVLQLPGTLAVAAVLLGASLPATAQPSASPPSASPPSASPPSASPSSASPPSASVPGEPGPRPAPVWPLRAALGVAALYAATLLAGFFVRQGRSFEHLERAATLAPGDPLVRLELAEAYVLEARCVEARPHLEALARQLPHHPSARMLRSSCGWP